MIPDNIPKKNRPVVRRLARCRITNARMMNGNVQFRYDGHDHVVPVRVRRTVMVGSNSPKRKYVEVDPRLKQRERKAVAVHEGVEKYVRKEYKLPPFASHVVAENVENRYDRQIGLNPFGNYMWHVEKIHRESMRRARGKKGKRRR